MNLICPVALCRNPVEGALAPCGDCTALFGPYMRPSGREAAASEIAALRARSEAKTASLAPRIMRPASRLSSGELAGEAVHLASYGISRGEIAGRLGVSLRVLETALARAREAA